MGDTRDGNDDRRVQVLLEEYRALYGLLTFRVGTLEQRLPMTGALFSAALAAGGMMPERTRLLVFLGLPLTLIGFVRSTLSHARAKQDVKLRIDEIERRVNRLMGEDLLAFQSRHPSRGRVVAGRSGRELILAVYFAALGLIGGCVLLYPSTGLFAGLTDAYALYAAMCALWVSIEVARLGRYRDARQLICGGEEA